MNEQCPIAMLFEENYRKPGANNMCADSCTQWVEVCIPSDGES